MRTYDIILKKRDGGDLSSEEIDHIVGGYARGDVPDAQMASWLMAVYFRGMSARETADLTMSMVRSGRTLDLSCIPGIKVDKHSTGGVGDKTTLVLIPILAAAGVPTVKMCGRSLGHTGGTIDKLESIPGFSTDITSERMVEQVARIGAVISGQTLDLVPADKKIYALRDITGTVDCIPLIAASVMCKKIAAGADAIVLDVKAGLGAFMKTVPQAVELAHAMVEIGNQVGKRTVALVTDMDQPLGRAVGNALEVRESIETLKGRGPDDLVDLCAALGGAALLLGGKAATREEGESMVRTLLASGDGLAKFRELIETQGGNTAVLDDPAILPAASVVRPVVSTGSGYVTSVNALGIATAALDLGAGRCEADASPDLSVGVYLHKKVGESVREGDLLAEIHSANTASAEAARETVLSAYEIVPEPCEKHPMIHQIID